MRAFRVYWCKFGGDEVESVDSEFTAIIIVDKIQDLIPAFEKAFPGADPNHIRNIENTFDIPVIATQS